MSILEQLAGAPVAVDERTRRVIRLQIADTVGAWLAGARTSEGRALVRFVSPRPGREGVLDRVMLNCAVTRLSEIDNIHLASGTTPGAVIVPAALTIAAALQVRRSDALEEAILAGYEAVIRLGLAIEGPKVLYRGIWPTYFTAGLGVAAVASRLIGLSATQGSHALGMALARAAPNVGQQGGPSMSRWLLFGEAARTGAAAALAAQAGFTGDPGLLDREFLTQVYGITPRAEAWTGAVPTAMDGISYKPWCAARQTMAAVQATKEIGAAGVAAPDIETITVGVPPAYLKMVNHGVVEGDRSSYLTSAPYQVALALLAPDTAYALEQSPAALGEPLRAAMGRVRVIADDSLMAHFPRTWPAKVTVSARSGSHEKLMLHVPGDPERPFAEADVAEKFRRVLSPSLGAAETGRLLERALQAQDPAALVAEIEAHYG
jgi:2-methylcitrate dehydratase PrpD